MDVRIEELAVFTTVQINPTVFTGISTLHLVDQLDFAVARMTVEDRRVHAEYGVLPVGVRQALSDRLSISLSSTQNPKAGTTTRKRLLNAP